jgi:hypothetical protein
VSAKQLFSRSIQQSIQDDANAAPALESRDSETAARRYLAERDIAPGDRLEIHERQPLNGAPLVGFGGWGRPSGGELARSVGVGAEGSRRPC